MSGLLVVEDLAGGYRAGADAITGLTLTVPEGATLAVLGPNGGGKTTFFRALLGELPHRSGRLELSGQVAYVPQTERARLDFPVTALDVALMGAHRRTPWYRPLGRAERVAAAAALERVGLADRAGDLFGELSGGQRQRVALARALVQDARILLLDEPLSGVDRPSAIAIERVFDELRGEGRAVLVATHDIHQARTCDLVLCLNERQVAFGSPDRVLTAEALRETYGAELVVLDDGRVAVPVDHHHHHH